MHHALEIQEILLNIVDHFRCPYGRPSRKDAPDLISLARTCRAFKEPAFDVLWEKLGDLTPLARCLPQACYQVSQYKYSLKRPLTPSEWDVLQSYSRRIRSIDTRGYSLGLDAESLRILENPPTTEPLFRNLRTLRVAYWTTDIKPRFRFPCPSLISLEVQVGCSNPSPDVLYLFPRFSPNVRSLVILARRPDAAFNDLVSNCIRGWKDLNTVSCPAITVDLDALAHLSRTSALAQLDFKVSATLPVSVSPLLFANLNHMTLESESLDAILRLISQSRLPAITVLEATVRNRPSKRELHSFWRSIEIQNAGHTLIHLSLEHLSTSPATRVVRTDAPLLCLEDLRPCMALHNLCEMRFRTEWDVGLKDAELLTLASAWPHLEVLELNMDVGWNTKGASGITPYGFLQLLQTCRSLRRIALVIDTQDFIEVPANGLFGLGVTLPFIALNVLDSPIEAESVLALATFFARTPSSYINVYTFLAESVRLPDWEVYRGRWQDVCLRAKTV